MRWGLHRMLPSFLDMGHLRNAFRDEVVSYSGGAHLTVVVFIFSVGIVVLFQRVLPRLRARWNKSLTGAALALGCIFLWLFIAVCGQHQFGAWDFGIVIDTAWRQIQGQRPYLDFVCPNPPGFNLAAFYAFKLLGVRWVSLVYATSTMACVSFLWIYWLFRQLGRSALVAFSLSTAIESACVLTLCFWWYNDEVAIAAVVFLLSCMAYLKRPEDRRVQASYLVSLALLPLMKPNIAGLMLIFCISLTFLATKKRARLFVLTLISFAATLLIMFANHISIPAMIQSYRLIAIERGGSSRFGFSQVSPRETNVDWAWLWMLALPIGISALLVTLQWIRERQWRSIVFLLFFPAMLIVSRYGMLTDGELKSVEWGIVIAAGGALLFVISVEENWLRVTYAATLFTLTIISVMIGATRVRVARIGANTFYVYGDKQFQPHSGLFDGLKASKHMGVVVDEVGNAAAINKGPIFLGPRLEFCYAAFRIPSPEGLPLYWQPGTSFARKDQDKYIQVWEEHRFQTLVFLQDEYIFYSPIFKQYIRDNYYPEQGTATTVWHRKADVARNEAQQNQAAKE